MSFPMPLVKTKKVLGDVPSAGTFLHFTLPRWHRSHYLGWTPSEEFVHFGICHFPVVQKDLGNAASVKPDVLVSEDVARRLHGR